MTCRVVEGVVGGGIRAITIENNVLSATLLPDKGADVYSLMHRASGIDVLLKAPWGLRRPGSGFAPAPDSEVAWLEHYEGGWQVLFPNGGNACVYKGVELPFHGEASSVPWDVTGIDSSPDSVWVSLSARLARSPFRIERTLSVRGEAPILTVEERVVNEGAESMAAMWSHHPAFGAPFLSSSCIIDTGARSVVADETYDTAGGRIRPGGRWLWPDVESRGGGRVDLRQVPERGDMLAYLCDFEDGWFAITNPELGFGVAMVWPAGVFPYAWLWQELRSSLEFPWFGTAYTIAVEPASSIPGTGLVSVMAKTGSHLTLEPGETRTMTLRAVLYTSGNARGVRHVAPDGTVSLLTETGQAE